MPVEASSLSHDREIGDYWEAQFELMITEFDFWCHRTQKGRTTSAQIVLNGVSVIAPDVFFGRKHQVLFGEIKHKSPNKHSNYGIEEYRVEHIVNLSEASYIPYLYVIHDWQDAGGKDINENQLQHWYAQSFRILLERDYKIFPGTSYRNGKVSKENVYYFPKKKFESLEKFLYL